MSKPTKEEFERMVEQLKIAVKLETLAVVALLQGRQSDPVKPSIDEATTALLSAWVANEGAVYGYALVDKDGVHCEFREVEGDINQVCASWNRGFWTAKPFRVVRLIAVGGER